MTRARIGALLALALAGAVVWFCVSLFQPFAGAGKGSVIVEIPKGSSAADIGSILAARHAGITQAANATERKRALTPSRFGTSTGLVSNSMD